MKVMRSTKGGSVCADCGTPIKEGDPIAYFGPRAIFGLTCHENEKTKKHLARLLEEEGGGSRVETDRRTNSATAVDVAAQQEWVVRVEWSTELAQGEDGVLLRWLLQGGFCTQLANTLNVLEFRAPRSIGLVVTESWAENLAQKWNVLLGTKGIAEATPRWV